MYKVILFNILLLFFVSCKSKNVPQIVHEDAPLEYEERNNLKQLEFKSDNKIVSYYQTQYEEIVNRDKSFLDTVLPSNYRNNKIASDTISEVIIPISNIIFDADILRDPKKKREKEDVLKDLLKLYHRAVIKSYFIAADLLYESQVLKLYEDKVFEGCEKGEGICVNYSLFAMDANNTKTIMKIIAFKLNSHIQEQKENNTCEDECKENVYDLYKVLKMAYAFKRGSVDTELEGLIVERAHDLAAYYSSSNGKEKIKLKDEFEFIRDTIFSKYSMTNVNESADKNTYLYKALKNFSNDYNIWLFSKREWSVLGSAGEMNFIYAAQHSQDELKIRKAVEELQVRDEKKSQNSFYKRIKELVKDNSMLFKNFEINVSDYEIDNLANVYFLLVNRLAEGHIDKVHAMALWEGSDKNKDKLIQVANRYLQAELIARITATNKFMRDLYLSDDVYGDNIYNFVLNQSRHENEKWGGLRDLILKIEDVIKEIFKNDKSNNLFVELKKKIDNHKRSILFSSVYTNMMLMTMFLSKLDGKLEFRTWFGYKIELESNTVIEHFYKGTWKPWFLFGNRQDISLNMFEILFSYIYAINIGMFDLYKEEAFADGTIIDIGEFYKNTMKGLLNDLNASYGLANALKTFEHEMLTNSSESEFEFLCEDISKFERKIDFSELESNIFFGTIENGPAKYAFKFFISGTRATEIDQIDKKYSKIFLYASYILEAYRNYIDLAEGELKKRNMYESEMKQYEYMKEIYNKYQHDANRFKELVLKYYKKISDCMMRAIKLESDLEFGFIEYEIEHLKKIHDNMTAIRNNLKMPYDIELIQDKFTKNDYTYSKHDAYMRIKKYLEIESLNPNIPKVIIDIKNKNKLDFVSDKVANTVHYWDEKDKFVKTALNLLAGNNTSYVKWFSNSSQTRSSEYMKNKILIARELYKAGYFTNLRSPKYFQCESDDKKCLDLNKTHIAEIILLEEVMDVINLYHISEKEAALLKELNIRNKYPNSADFKSIILDDDEKTVLPVFMRLYKDMTEVDSRDAGTIHADFKTIGRKLYDFYKKDENQFLLGVDNSYCKILRSMYQKEILKRDLQVERLEQVVEYMPEIYQNLPFEYNSELGVKVISLQLDENMERTFLELDQDNINSYLDMQKIENQRELRKNFYTNDTKYYFLPHQGDEACAKDSNHESCNYKILNYCTGESEMWNDVK